MRRSNWIPFVFYGLFNRLIRIRATYAATMKVPVRDGRNQPKRRMARLIGRNERIRVHDAGAFGHITVETTPPPYIIPPAVVNVPEAKSKIRENTLETRPNKYSDYCI